MMFLCGFVPVASNMTYIYIRRRRARWLKLLFEVENFFTFFPLHEKKILCSWMHTRLLAWFCIAENTLGFPLIEFSCLSVQLTHHINQPYRWRLQFSFKKTLQESWWYSWGFKRIIMLGIGEVWYVNRKILVYIATLKSIECNYFRYTYTYIFAMNTWHTRLSLRCLLSLHYMHMSWAGRCFWIKTL